MTEENKKVVLPLLQAEQIYSELQRLEQENKELKEDTEKISDGLLKIQYKLANNCDKYRSALEEIKRVVKLAHKVEDYLLGQDYTDLVDRIEKEINEVLNDN